MVVACPILASEIISEEARGGDKSDDLISKQRLNDGRWRPQQPQKKRLTQFNCFTIEMRFRCFLVFEATRQCVLCGVSIQPMNSSFLSLRFGVSHCFCSCRFNRYFSVCVYVASAHTIGRVIIIQLNAMTDEVMFGVSANCFDLWAKWSHATGQGRRRRRKNVAIVSYGRLFIMRFDTQ